MILCLRFLTAALCLAAFAKPALHASLAHKASGIHKSCSCSNIAVTAATTQTLTSCVPCFTTWDLRFTAGTQESQASDCASEAHSRSLHATTNRVLTSASVAPAPHSSADTASVPDSSVQPGTTTSYRQVQLAPVSNQSADARAAIVATISLHGQGLIPFGPAQRQALMDALGATVTASTHMALTSMELLSVSEFVPNNTTSSPAPSRRLLVRHPLPGKRDTSQEYTTTQGQAKSRMHPGLGSDSAPTLPNITAKPVLVSSHVFLHALNAAQMQPVSSNTANRYCLPRMHRMPVQVTAVVCKCLVGRLRTTMQANACRLWHTLQICCATQNVCTCREELAAGACGSLCGSSNSCSDLRQHGHEPPGAAECNHPQT